MLCEAVGKREAYLCGYPKPFGWSTVMKWWKKHEREEQEMYDFDGIFATNRKRKRNSYIQAIQEKYPGFLHELYRYASNTIGHNSNNFRVRTLMIKKARLDYPNCPVRGKLILTKHHFKTFFTNNGGKYKKISSKPRLSETQMRHRLIWVKKHAELIKKKNFYYCFLDEKWFYCSSNRKKFKYLPPNVQIGETEEDADVPIPRVRTRRKPCKVMYLACAGEPNKENGFDGKVLMERVSKYEKAKATSHTQRFSSDYQINEMLKRGTWKQMYVEGMAAHVLFSNIQDCFGIEEYIADRFVLTYKTYAKTLKTSYCKHIDLFDGGKNEMKDILDRMIRTKDGVHRKLTLNDCKLQVQNLRGMYVEKDTTCDTEYMLEIVDHLGQSIRKAYHWLPKKTVPIHLVMDNAGGHGTELGKLQYLSILRRKYNVHIIWQISNSPETNILDLGLWCMLQSLVEYMHRNQRMHPDVLGETVERAWHHIDGMVKIPPIIDRWKRVLGLIMLGNGGNELVDKCRGCHPSIDDFVDLFVEVDGMEDDGKDLYLEMGENDVSDSECSDMSISDEEDCSDDEQQRKKK